MKPTAFGSALLGIVLSFSANAYVIEDLHFNASRQEISVSLVYPGGCKEHQWHWLFDECVEGSTVNQLAARLVDSGWDDTCENEIHQTLIFDVGTVACFSQKTEFTVLVGKKHQTILVP